MGNPMKDETMVVRTSLAATFAVLLFVAPSMSRADRAVAYPSTLTLKDGTVAVPAQECGVGEVCATVTMPNNDVITFYSEGSQKNQTYKIHAVRMHGNVVLVSFEVELNRGKNKQSSGETILDDGKLHIGFYQNHNGNLFAHVWAPNGKDVKATGTQAPAQQ